LGALETKRTCHGLAVVTGVFGMKEGRVASRVALTLEGRKDVVDPLPAEVVV